MPAQRRPAPSCAAAAGSSTGPRRSSPTAGTEITGGTTITAVTGTATGRAQGDLQSDRARRTRRASAAPRSIARWAGAPRTPASCRSSTLPSRRTTCSARAARGSSNFSTVLDGGRISVAALSVGLAWGAYDEALKYAQTADCVRPARSRSFKRSSSSSPTCSWRSSTRAIMVLKAAWEKDAGREFALTASLAKLYLRRSFAPGRQRGGADPRRLRVYG